MTGCVDKAQLKMLCLAVCVWECYGLAFYGYSPLPLNIHVIKDLVTKLALVHQTGVLYKAIRERRLSMVDVGYNTEISYVFHDCLLK